MVKVPIVHTPVLEHVPPHLFPLNQLLPLLYLLTIDKDK